MTTSTRQLVRDILERRFDGLDEYAVPTIVDEVTGQIRADPDLYTAYVDEALREMVHGEALHVIHLNRVRTRRDSDAADAVARLVTDAPSTYRPLAQRMKGGRSSGLRWLSHAEYIGGGHVKLMAMTGLQLDMAISYRLQQLDGHVKMVGVLQELRRTVPDGASVAERFTAKEIEAIFEQVRDRQDPPPTDPIV